MDKIITFLLSIITSLGGVVGFQQAADTDASSLSKLSSDFITPPSVPASVDKMNSIYPDILERVINEKRVAAGLPARVPDASMDEAVANHARQMAIRGTTFHSAEFADHELVYEQTRQSFNPYFYLDEVFADPATSAKALNPNYTKFEAGVAQTVDGRIVLVIRFA